MIKVLSIAGSDPSGGAGIQLDLKVFQSLGAFGMALPAALTAQSSRGVYRTYPIPSKVVYEQLETLFSDMRPDAVKTGMLMTSQNVKAIADIVTRFKIKNLIIDTVIRSTSRYELLSTNGIDALRRHLLPFALLTTPNLPEVQVLTGITIKNEADMERAARRLLDSGVSYVLIKGGHSTGLATDTLYGGRKPLSFSTSRRAGEFHGTGCALSAAITVFIARGYTVEKAVEKAKEYVNSLFKTARPVGKGRVKYFRL